MPVNTHSPVVAFRTAPHLAVEGTLYSHRTATVLAVISVLSHIPHLLEPATNLLTETKGTWLNRQTPENFTLDFAQLLLSLPSSDVALTESEKLSYEGMRRYTHLERLIDTKIQGVVPWSALKSRGVGDRKRVCERCGIRRSETMLHDDLNACGMCVDCDTKDPKDWKDLGEIQSCWVECSERYCHAQYVIEDEEGLRVSFQFGYQEH